MRSLLFKLFVAGGTAFVFLSVLLALDTGGLRQVTAFALAGLFTLATAFFALTQVTLVRLSQSDGSSITTDRRPR